jgi:hypothetical protein
MLKGRLVLESSTRDLLQRRELHDLYFNLATPKPHPAAASPSLQA